MADTTWTPHHLFNMAKGEAITESNELYSRFNMLKYLPGYLHYCSFPFSRGFHFDLWF